MGINLHKILFNSLPEYILLIYVGVGLLGIKGKLTDYLKLGIISTGVFWIIREFLNLFGYHFLLMVIFIGLMIKIVIKIKFKQGIIASLLGHLIVALGEVIFFYLSTEIFNVEVVNLIRTTTVYYYLLAYLVKSPLIILAILIFKYDFKLIDLGGE